MQNLGCIWITCMMCFNFSLWFFKCEPCECVNQSEPPSVNKMCKSLWCCSLSPSGQRPANPNVNPQASNQNVHNAHQPAQILRPKCTAADTNVHLSINLQLRPEWTAGRMSCGPTYTNRDAMQCKAMQYGMQYYPMLGNAIQCARIQWWTESQTQAVSQEAGYIWTTCLWTNFEAETGDCFKHTNARGHLKGKDCHRILFSSFWWGEGPTTQGTTFFVAFMYESSVLHICCCLSSFLCCVSSFLLLFIISTLFFFTACCSSPIRCCSWSWLTARVENRCGDHIIPIGRIAILQNMCTPFSSESHWHWSFNLNILLIHIWTIGQ